MNIVLNGKHSVKVLLATALLALLENVGSEAVESAASLAARIDAGELG